MLTPSGKRKSHIMLGHTSGSRSNAPLGISIALVACIPFALLVFLVSKRKGKQS